MDDKNIPEVRNNRNCKSYKDRDNKTDNFIDRVLNNMEIISLQMVSKK